MPQHHRLVLPRGRQHHVDLDAEMAVRRHHLVDQRRERGAIEERRVGGRKLGELAEDLAAALRLLAQQAHILGLRRIAGKRALQLPGDHRDRRERRREFMSGGGRQPVELGKMLLARENEFGRRERVGQAARALGDLPRIDADIAERQHDAEPDAHHVERRQNERIVARPGQRLMDEQQHRRPRHRESAEHQRVARRQRHRGDKHGRQKQERERILQSARLVEQQRLLRHVEGQHPGGEHGRDARRHAVAQHQRHIHPGGQRDDGEARP